MTKTTVPAHSMEALMNKKLLRNLEIHSNAAAAISKVDIDSGLVGSDDGTTIMEVPSTITVDIAASGANGLDTGSEAVSTWYYLYLIYNPSTDTEAGLFSASASSPTMPSGYTKKRLISAVYNHSGGDFLTFRQDDYEFYQLGYQSVLAAGTATSWTAVTMGNFIPSNICRTAKMLGLAIYGGTAGVNSRQSYIAWKTGTIWTGLMWRRGASGDLNINTQTLDIPLDTKSPPTIWYYNTHAASNFNLYVVGCRLNL